jgi:hypothetical protein
MNHLEKRSLGVSPDEYAILISIAARVEILADYAGKISDRRLLELLQKWKDHQATEAQLI